MQLEFDKVKTLLALHCRTEYAKDKADHLRIHTKKEFIENELQQASEFKLLLQSGQHFPSDFVLNLQKELKLLGIPGAVLKGEHFLQIKKSSLAELFLKDPQRGKKFCLTEKNLHFDYSKNPVLKKTLTVKCLL